MFEDIDIKKLPIPKENEFILVRFSDNTITPKSEFLVMADKLRNVFNNIAGRKVNILFVPANLDFEILSKDQMKQQLENIIEKISENP